MSISKYDIIYLNTFNDQLTTKYKLHNLSMSHFSKIKTALKDLEMLKASLNDLGITFDISKSTMQGYKNQTHSADLIIKQSNNYDIGFIWNGSEYQLVTDIQFWQQPWPVDLFINRLNQRYAYNSIVKVSESKGFQTIEESPELNGSVRLTLQRWN
jgi:hypothetical protein